MVEEIRPPAPPRPGWLAALLPLVLIIWGFVGAYLIQLGIESTSRVRSGEKLLQELAYFPSGRLIREASIEYQTLAADVIWLVAINYYGHHLQTDQRYDWLGHIFQQLTVLDPAFVGAYHFGAMTLAWDARKPDSAIALLTSGMKANPMNWQLPFDAGFITFMHGRNRDERTAALSAERAARFFAVSSRLPGAWSVVERWVPYVTAQAGNYDAAEQMWRDIYYRTENRKLRELVIRQVKNLRLDERIDRLQEGVNRFRETEGRLPRNLAEVVERGFLLEIPEEPFGGRFYLDGATVRTTTPPGRRN